jgi:ectoine hydroxylase-related dioxygenase (phytanoyl-CoA dioxygenase family)
MSDDHKAFQRDGHVLVRGLAGRAEAEAYRPAIEEAVARAADDAQGRIDDYSKLFTQVTNIWRLSEAARRVVFEPRFARAAAQLLGVRAVRLYHDQALFKPPGAGRTLWHQDRYYWPLDTDATVTMWLALVDIDDDMGLMRFASGSHRAGGAYRAIDDDAHPDESRLRIWSAPPMRAGDATFHAGGTLHSAGANHSGRTREVLTVIYYADSAHVAEPANQNQRVDLEVFLPGARPGDAAATALNPILWSTDCDSPSAS